MYICQRVCALSDISEAVEKVAHWLLCIAAAVTIFSLDLHILLCLGTIYISICHPRVEAISAISHDVRVGT